MNGINFNERLARDRRLVILRLLGEAPGYSANSSILHGLLGDFGHRVSRDNTATDIDWLAEQGLVEVEELAAPGLRIVTLTKRGQDVAEGNAQVTGVARPSPHR